MTRPSRKSALIAALTAACLVGGAALAQSAATQNAADMPRAVVKAGYKVSRLADGRPDLGGAWTNATSTPLARQASYGQRLAMTPEEAAKIEGDTAVRNKRINAPTAKDVQDNWTTKLAKGPDTLDECRGGSRGVACGYNAGWTDPGDLIMRVNGQPRTSLITVPANGQMPPRVPGAGRGAPRPQVIEDGEGSLAVSRGTNDNPEQRGLADRCMMSFGISSGPVMTPQLYNNSYRIVQGKDSVAIWVEMVHDVRIVRIGGKHRTDGIRTFMGDSIGWWDGDSLVVETVGFHPQQNVRGAGPNVKVTERFTRVAPTRLHYAFRVEDSETWTQPWGGEYEFASTGGVYEYACHEGNYALEGILAGARYEEQQAAAKGKTAPR